MSCSPQLCGNIRISHSKVALSLNIIEVSLNEIHTSESLVSSTNHKKYKKIGKLMRALNLMV